MQIYRCRLTLQDPLFHATRELGRLYETGRYLHNYALTYAFGMAVSPWFHREQVPHYADDLRPLGGQVYVTPAQPEQVMFQLSTFKYGEEILHVEMQQAERNTPSFGRAKEIAPESTFACYVVSAAPLRLPRWIRLGKWHSKALVDVADIEVKEASGDYAAACPLNPLDVPAGALRAFDIISMPPASLVANARCSGPHYQVGRGVGIPVGMRYTFS
jgi:CRISPR-associated protein Csc1